MILSPKTGFQAKFVNPFYRKLFLDRSYMVEEELNKDKDPPDQDIGLDTKKLDDLAQKSQEPLLKIRTAIPLDPFPNEIIIDTNKINIIIRYFFASAHIHSVFIKDVSDVIVETSLIFSTLKLVDVGFTENSIDMSFLRNKDAIKARKIIQGLVVAQKNGVDLAKYEGEDLVLKLEQIGTAWTV